MKLRRITAMILAAALCVSSVPFSVWAEESIEEVESESIIEENSSEEMIESGASDENIEEQFVIEEDSNSAEMSVEQAEEENDPKEESNLISEEMETGEQGNTDIEIVNTGEESVSKEAMQASSYGLSNPRSVAFTGLNAYGDECVDLKTTWDCVYFGNYPQSDSTGATKEPIKWRVLSVNGDDAFLLADQNLDCQPYNTDSVEVTWETCTLRAWMDNDFYNSAFTSSEQAAILTTTVVNDDNPEYGTKGGINTQDKVYLLSISEVLNEDYGYPGDYSINSATRWAKNTAYAEAQGAYTYFIDTTYSGNGNWWLRSPGKDAYIAAVMDGRGFVSGYGHNVSDSIRAVRPALHLNLSSSLWTYAGTVSSYDPGTGDNPGAGDNSGGSGTGVTQGGSGTVPNTSGGVATKLVGSSASAVKAVNPMIVNAKTATVKYSKLSKKKQTVKAKKAFVITGAQGKISYKVAKYDKKAKKKITVSKTGKITIKKGLKKGTYKLKVKVTAAGNANYLPATKTVTLKIKVR